MATSVVACRRSLLALVVLAIVAVSVPGVPGSSNKLFNISNSCSYTVWPAISTGANSAATDTSTGFELAPGQWELVPVPSRWSGRMWGRTLCSSNSSGSGGSTTDASRFSCVTGDCGSGSQECEGGNAAPPVTLAQFTLTADGNKGTDSFDVSLVDGFNLPMLVAPQGMAAPPGGNCAPTGCLADLNDACPDELRVRSAETGAGATVACKSACLAFGSPQYCCTGAYGTPDTCKPSAYSELFKHACPRAYSYAYDSAASTSICAGGDTYTVTFCPSTTSSGRSSTSPNSQPPETGNLPHAHVDGSTTPYTGSGSQVVGGATAPWRIILVVGVLSAVTAALGLLANFLGLFKLCCNQAAAGAAGA